MKKSRINVSLSQDILDAIRKEAWIRDVSMSQVVREIIRKSLNA